MTEYKINLDDIEHSIIILNDRDKMKGNGSSLTDFTFKSRDIMSWAHFIVYIDDNYQYKVLKDRGDNQIYYEMLQNEIRNKKLKFLLQ